MALHFFCPNIPFSSKESFMDAQSLNSVQLLFFFYYMYIQVRGHDLLCQFTASLAHIWLLINTTQHIFHACVFLRKWMQFMCFGDLMFLSIWGVLLGLSVVCKWACDANVLVHYPLKWKHTVAHCSLESSVNTALYLTMQIVRGNNLY